MSTDGAWVLGNDGASIAIVEFAQYQCPYCAQHATITLPRLLKDYVSTGKALYVFQDFPTGRLPNLAFEAAEAARGAGAQRRYQAMHDYLYAERRGLARMGWGQHAAAVGLDRREFTQCMDTGRFRADVKAGIAEGTAAGVHGTPTVFIGPIVDGRVEPRVILRGAQRYVAFKQALEALLAESG